MNGEDQHPCQKRPLCRCDPNAPHDCVLNLKPIRDRLEGPFSPFVIHLSDGRGFTIPHRDFVAVGKRVVSIVDRHDSTHTVDALHIVSINDLPRKRDKAAR